MPDAYYVDLGLYRLAEYGEELGRLKLSKARRPLQECLVERFAALEAAGIDNLDDLLSAIGTAKRRQALADETGVPVEYLILLRRQANGYRPKPVSLGAFPEADTETVAWLASQGIRQSRQMLARMVCRTDCQEAADSPTRADALWALVRMSDLVRVNGVGPIFARMMLAVGMDSVSKLARADANPLYTQLTELNNRVGYTKSWFSLAEMQTCIDFARILPVIVDADLD